MPSTLTESSYIYSDKNSHKLYINGPKILMKTWAKELWTQDMLLS